VPVDPTAGTGLALAVGSRPGKRTLPSSIRDVSGRQGGVEGCPARHPRFARAMLPFMAAPAIPPPGFDDLSPEDKLNYIHALWARFTADPEDIPVPEWHHEVIAQRLAAAEQREDSARQWGAVREDLLKKLRDVRR
jgi:hypothetical protein